MGQIVTQGVSADLITAITRSDGVAATGLLYTDVQVQYRKEGDPSFNSKALTAMNFVELGFGFYRITFDATELSVPGSFAFVVFGAGLQNANNEAQVRATGSTIPTVPVALPTCEITGNLNDMGGNPVVGAAVSAKLLGMPTIAGAVGVGDDLQTVTTDDNGVFVLTLIRLATVEIYIPRINYRRQLVVPNLANVNLFTGIP